MLSRCVIGCCAALMLAPPALAGPLSPPAGPIAASGRFGPRVEINAVNTPGDVDSLFRIAAPGSYYLGGNVTGVNGKHGIEIGSSGVTIDLMGFELRGAPGSFVGIRTDGARNNLTVRNGVVTMWGRDGIDLLDGGPGLGSLIEKIHVTQNVGIGIRSTTNGIIRSCTAINNGSIGIIGVNNSIVESCAVRDNSGNGISVGNGSLVTGCIARDNGGAGISTTLGGTVSGCTSYSNAGNGFSVGVGSTISVCSAYLNTGDGLHGSSETMIESCNARSNSGDGIDVGDNSVIRGCTSSLNTLNGYRALDSCRISDSSGSSNGGYGFQAQVAAAVSGCAAESNGSDGILVSVGSVVIGCSSASNTGNGIWGSSGSMIRNCSARRNGQDGISAFEGTIIESCIAWANSGDGIQVINDCSVLNNHCDGNGFGAAFGSGINVSNSGNRIRGNCVTDNDIGIVLSTGGNIMIRNSAAGNTTEYSFVANNAVAVILTRINMNSSFVGFANFDF